MSLGRYYRLLGLPVTASDDEVRKRYRKLAMHYHPDKNTSPGAEKKFMAIVEAYEVLTGKRPSPIRKTQRSSTAKRKTTPGATSANAKSQKDRVREARTRYEDQQKREQIENEIYFRRLTGGRKWKMMRVSAFFGAILALCMVLDRFLPHHFEEDQITHYSLNRAYSGSGEVLSVVQTKDGAQHWISHINYNLYGRNHNVQTETSWIFHQPIRLVSNAKIYTSTYDIYYSFFSNFIFVIVLFLLPLITYYYKRRTITFTILFQSSYFGINALILYFIFANDHWAHLLTLGFF